MQQVIRPVTFGALTTISVFAAFFASRVEGYRQMALLANLSILICLFFSLFILPHFVGGHRPVQNDLGHQNRLARMRRPVSDTFRIVVGSVFLLFFIALGPRLSFDNDIMQYDATERSVVAAEEDFHRIWGAGTTPAILVVPGNTLEEALRTNDAIYDQAIQAIGAEHFSSISPLWPSKIRRQASLQRWEGFWSRERETQLKAMLAEYGETYHFSEDAFQPFLDHLHATGALEDWPSGLPFFEQLKERFVTKVDNQYQILSFFPDKDEYISRLQIITDGYPQTLIVARKHFSQTVSHAAISELLRVSLIGILATILLTWWLLKSLRLMFLALLPVLISLVAILGVLSALGHALNITAIIASLVTVGIVSDYGMFVVYYCQNQFRTGTCAAVTFAAITTLIGSAALLFAKHPMLFSVGIVMSTGVLSGFLSSLLVLPPLFRKICRKSSLAISSTAGHE
jgi:predicted exporter